MDRQFFWQGVRGALMAARHGALDRAKDAHDRGDKLNESGWLQAEEALADAYRWLVVLGHDTGDDQ